MKVEAPLEGYPKVQRLAVWYVIVGGCVLLRRWGLELRAVGQRALIMLHLLYKS